MLHIINENCFLEMSHEYLLVCYADLYGMILLAVLFLLPLPNCFLKVCLPNFFAAVLKLFLPLTTAAISGAINSCKSAPTRFTAGTLCLQENGIAVLPITFASESKPRPRCRPNHQ